MILFSGIRWRENGRGLIDMTRHLLRATGKVSETWFFALVFLLRRNHPERSSGACVRPVSVIIVGGEFRNKGSQAMTFVAIDQIRQRCPDAAIHLFSPFDLALAEKGRCALRLSTVPWIWTTKRRLLMPGKIRDGVAGEQDKLRAVVGVLRGATAIIDVSGYAFSSQWGGVKSFEYLASLMIARRFGAPYFILPQSIGPLDYRGSDRWFVPRWLIRRCLQGAVRIFAREASGLQAVMAYSPHNVVLTRDIVLMNPEPDLSRIYVQPPVQRPWQIEPGSVGVIPNVKVVRHTAETGMRDGYLSLARTLREAGRPVYLLAHAVQDLPVCRQIKTHFSGDPGVQLIDEELSATQLYEVIRQFDFVVASRYHAVIHAFKQGVPALVLGWADKYRELLKEFGQESYGFDVRDGVSEEAVRVALRQLLSNHQQEQHHIRKVLANLTGENPFDQLGL